VTGERGRLYSKRPMSWGERRGEKEDRYAEREKKKRRRGSGNQAWLSTWGGELLHELIGERLKVALGG